MLNFKAEFYKKLFESLDNNSVLMQVGANGSYRPIWCSREYAEMMEGTPEECLRYEREEVTSAVHPDDKEEVAFLFKNHAARNGGNSLTIRKFTVRNHEIWINIHYSKIICFIYTPS